MTTAKEDYAYKALPNVVLTGVEVSRCTECGEWEVELPRLDELTRAVVRAVCEKPERLSGPEVRFLRKAIGWTAENLAAHMKVAAETVSRWETDRKRIGQQADLLLRVMALTLQPVDGCQTLNTYIDMFPRLAGTSAAAGAPIRLSVAEWGGGQAELAC